MDFQLRFDPLTSSDAEQIRQLAMRAQEADGTQPLNDQTLANLASDDTDITHIVARTVAQSPNGDATAPTIVGYAQVDRRQPTISGELVVDPATRRQGVGRALLRSAIRDATLPSRSGEPGQHAGLHIWSHAGHPGAAALASSENLVPVREICLMTRPLGDIAADSVTDVINHFRPELVVSTLDPARDNDKWLTLNAAAFQHHPEQGGWTLADLEERQRTDWFNADDCYVVSSADNPDELVASLWLKLQPQTPLTGEIYVVAVHPAAQGRGLGKKLTYLALAHMRAHGRQTAELWTDTTNEAAVAVYRQAGFDIATTQIQYARTSTTQP